MDISASMDVISKCVLLNDDKKSQHRMVNYRVHNVVIF